MLVVGWILLVDGLHACKMFEIVNVVHHVEEETEFLVAR